MKSLKNRTALVTGAVRENGIGFAIAKQLAKNGADLLIHSYNAYDAKLMGKDNVSDPQHVLGKLAKYNIRAEHFDADFSDPKSVMELFNFSRKIFGHIDILILNHTHDTLKTLHQLTPGEINRHLKVNVTASLLLIQQFSRYHDGRPGGRIIMLTSGQHLGPMPHPAYVASKGALHHLTVSISDELISRGITVNTVHPGPTRTYTPDPEIDQAVLKRMPLGRWGEPEDAARLIGWLVSDDARWITGQVIDSEGGFRRG